MRSRRAGWLWFSRLSLVLGILALCGLLTTQTVRLSAATPAYIRVIHASPAVGTADIFVDGKLLLSSFAFGAVTDYVPLPSGPHKVQIALVGKGIGASALSQTLDVQPGVVYTAAAIGSQLTGLSIAVFIDNNVLVAGKAKMRVYNLAPDAGSFTVAANGSTLLSQVGYQQASDYLTLSSGSYDFMLDASSAQVKLPLSETLGMNTVTSIFVVGLVNGSPKIELVPAQVKGVPGLPPTGSDPTPLPDAVRSQSLLSWLLSIVAALLFGASIIFRRRAVALAR